MQDRNISSLASSQWPFNPPENADNAEHRRMHLTVQPAVLEALSLDRILCTTSPTALNSHIGAATSEKTNALLESERVLPSLALSSQDFLLPVSSSLQAQRLPPTNEKPSARQVDIASPAPVPDCVGLGKLLDSILSPHSASCERSSWHALLH